MLKRCWTVLGMVKKNRKIRKIVIRIKHAKILDGV